MTPPSPLGVGTWPLAARLADITVLSNGWQILVVPEQQQTSVVEAIAGELAALVERPVLHRVVSNSRALEDAAHLDLDAPLIVSGLGVFSDDDWRNADMARSRLGRRGQTLLILAPQEVARIPALAPNLWSWIGDGVWTYAPETGLDEAEREERLAGLRAQFGFDDAELVRRARHGDLPPEADIAEWLVLIGEASLLKH